ncbi:MAG: hypothetical protein FWB98_08705 [Defluviitaleaceae bacterium]|nr:hypothetical protein [Defluviitaleaceae bacterium]
MVNREEIRNKIVEARRDVSASLLFVCLDTLYQIELDEQGVRIELNLDECQFNQKALELLRNTFVQLENLYCPMA